MNYLKLLVFLALAAGICAQTTGKISGIVTDKNSGEALPGVNVIVEGTRLGASTDVDGFYVILNVPVGTHDIKFSYVGYAETTIKDARVYVDNATEVNVELSEQVDVGDEVVVIAQRALIRKEETNSRQIRTSDDIKNLPVNSVQEIVGLTAGVVKQDNSNTLNVRGGRGSETAIMIDGVVQNSSYDGVVTGTVNRNAVEEVTVQSGNFSARYGQALSGLVQTSIKSGSDKYKFSFEAVSDKAGPKASRYGYTDYNLTASGPIVPGSQNYFFISVGQNWQDDSNPSWGYDGIKPNSRDEFSIAANIKSQITDEITLKLTTTYNDINRDAYSHGRAYWNGEKKPQHFYLVEESNLSNSFSLSHVVSKDFYYEIKAGFKQFQFEGMDSKWKDNFMAYGNQALNSYKGDAAHDDDARMYGAISQDGSLAQDPGSATTTEDDNLSLDRLYTRTASFADLRSYNYVFNRYDKRYEENIDVSINGNYTYDVHQIAFGFNYNRAKMHRYRLFPAALSTGGESVPTSSEYVANIASATFGYDIAGNWSDDGNFLNGVNGDDYKTPGKNGALAPKTPYQVSAYVEDVVRVDEFFLNFGVRFDHFDPNQKRFKNILFPSGVYDPSDDNKEAVIHDEDLEDSEPFNEISPRLGLSFPVTESTKFSASIGRFVQMPTYNQMMVNPYQWSNAGTTFLNQPNPNLKPQKSIQYEMSINHTLNEDMVVGVRTYFRQITDLITSGLLNNGIYGQTLYTVNQDHSTVKGLELTLETRRINNYQLFASYTYSTAFGTGSGPNTSIRTASNNIFTKFEKTLDFNVPHVLNVNLDYRFFAGQGPSLFGTKILENFGANMQFVYQSGLPYTSRPVLNSLDEINTRNPIATSDVNALSMPARSSVNLKLDKTFNLNVGSQEIGLNFYVDIRNLLDTENILDVHRATGRPNTDGYLESQASWQDPKTNNDYKRAAYKYMINNPALWGTPRLVRFGMRVNL